MSWCVASASLSVTRKSHSRRFIWSELLTIVESCESPRIERSNKEQWSEIKILQVKLYQCLSKPETGDLWNLNKEKSKSETNFAHPNYVCFSLTMTNNDWILITIVSSSFDQDHCAPSLSIGRLIVEFADFRYATFSREITRYEAFTSSQCMRWQISGPKVDESELVMQWLTFTRKEFLLNPLNRTHSA